MVPQAGRKALLGRPQGGQSSPEKSALHALDGIKAQIEKPEIRKDS